MELAKRLSPGPAALLIGAAALAACSPVYVAKSAAGHASLLARRRPIAKALRDPKTPPELRRRLSLVEDARRFAFDRLGLKRSRDYSSFVLKKGPLSFVVSGSEKLKLKPVLWNFPLVGRFPYKGHFKLKDAKREKAKLEKKGLDAFIAGAAAYNTPLWFADPIPSSALEDSTGTVAGLIIHELAHGTVFYKNQMSFNEAAASFIGQQGATQYLVERFGPESAELKAFEEESRREAAFEAELVALRVEREKLYASGLPNEAKLAERERLFTASRAKIVALGLDVPELNNAAVLAYSVYRGDLPLMRRAVERSGRDWPRFLALLKALDERDPSGDLTSSIAPGRR